MLMEFHVNDNEIADKFLCICCSYTDGDVLVCLIIMYSLCFQESDEASVVSACCSDN